MLCDKGGDMQTVVFHWVWACWLYKPVIMLTLMKQMRDYHQKTPEWNGCDVLRTWYIMLLGMISCCPSVLFPHGNYREFLLNIWIPSNTLRNRPNLLAQGLSQIQSDNETWVQACAGFSRLQTSSVVYDCWRLLVYIFLSKIYHYFTLKSWNISYWFDAWKPLLYPLWSSYIVLY